MASEWYPVYVIRYNIALPDPHMPPGRLHHAIFVQTKTRGSGVVHHVIGDITSRHGMSYEDKKTHDPRGSRSFNSQEFLGYTHSSYYPDQWKSILGSLPTPPQQKASNPQRHGRVEPFKEKINDHQYVFYEPEEEHEPLWKCTEWVEQLAIPALEEYGLIQTEVPTESSSSQSQSTDYEWVWDEAAQLYRHWDETLNDWIWEEG